MLFNDFYQKSYKKREAIKRAAALANGNILNEMNTFNKTKNQPNSNGVIGHTDGLKSETPELNGNIIEASNQNQIEHNDLRSRKV